jgi:aryl-alcohol dehydrogenase-like predicted oxidoreductase
VARILERLNTELEAGRVRALGASNWEYSRIDEANRYAQDHGLTGFAVVSNNLSLAVPTMPFYSGLVSTDKEGELWHERTGIPLIPWSSQARGFFTGRFGPPAPTDANALDGFARRMIEVYGTEANYERLRRATELGARNGGYTAVQVALAWLLHKPFPIVPIVGPHSEDELASCAAALALQLSEAEIKWLDLEA